MGLMDLITGQNAIAHALSNPKRLEKNLYCLEEGVGNLKKLARNNKVVIDWNFSGLKIHVLSSKEKLENNFQKLNKEGPSSRIINNMFLVATALPIKNFLDLKQDLLAQKKFCIWPVLDMVSDIHNLAAIVRTAAFFGIKGVIFSRKNMPKIPQSLFRIASGGLEHVSLYNCSALSRGLKDLKKNIPNISLIGLGEGGTNHLEEEIQKKEYDSKKQILLVLGSEEEGISNAILYNGLDALCVLPSQGQIYSLNVSVAMGIALKSLQKDFKNN